MAIKYLRTTEAFRTADECELETVEVVNERTGDKSKVKRPKLDSNGLRTVKRRGRSVKGNTTWPASDPIVKGREDLFVPLDPEGA